MTDIADLPTDRQAPGLIANLMRKVFTDKLQFMTGGTLVLEQGDQTLELGSGEPRLHVQINNPQVWTRMVLGGPTAAGEAYVDGDWDCDDLVGVMRLLLSNKPAYNRMGNGLARLLTPFRRLRQWQRRNSRSGSRRNITAHYDLGNGFYQLWLDDAMMYSSALFSRPDMTLEQASRAKLAEVCSKLALKHTDHVLEIGSGWGGFAIYAAQHFGCRVTTVTISQAQYTWAKRRIDEAGLQDLIKIELKDYRDLKGQYDKLVSIEMVEAVGEAYIPGYLKKCGELLKPGGVFVLQGIVIHEALYDNYKRGEDFIQKHIFPGGFLPCLSGLVNTLDKVTDLQVTEQDDMGADYAQTLVHWRERFLRSSETLLGMGFDDRFLRLWLFYLCYCESGFREQTISVVQIQSVKPE